MDQDETPLLYKDKELDASPIVPSRRRSPPRLGRRLVPLVLVVAAMVFGGLLILGGVPQRLKAVVSRESDLDLLMRLRLLLQRMEEHYSPRPTHDTPVLTLPAIRRLISCIEAGTCGPGERDVVLFACQRFAGATRGAVSGENIWAASTIRAFRAMNNTLLFGQGAMDALLMYQHVPELVKVVFWESRSFDACIARNGTGPLKGELAKDYELSPDNWQGGLPSQKGCMVRPDFPDGIPYYKSLVFHFWGEPRSPLGREFTLAPWNLSLSQKETNSFLGFSIEDHCMTNRYYPPEERKHQALILGKLKEYFYPGEHNWVAPETIAEAAKTLPREDGNEFKLLSYAKESEENYTAAALPEPIISLGFMKQADWTDLLARSKVLVSCCAAGR